MQKAFLTLTKQMGFLIPILNGTYSSMDPPKLAYLWLEYAASFATALYTVHHQVLAWYHSKLLHKDPKRPQIQIPVRQTRLN